MDTAQKIKALIEEISLDDIGEDEMNIVDIQKLFPDTPRRTLNDRLTRLVVRGKMSMRKDRRGHNIYKVLS